LGIKRPDGEREIENIITWVSGPCRVGFQSYAARISFRPPTLHEIILEITINSIILYWPFTRARPKASILTDSTIKLMNSFWIVRYIERLRAESGMDSVLADEAICFFSCASISFIGKQRLNRNKFKTPYSGCRYFTHQWTVFLVFVKHPVIRKSSTSPKYYGSQREATGHSHNSRKLSSTLSS
jgi:hypothetical protein